MDLPQYDPRSAGELLAGAERLERMAARTDLNQGLRDSSLAACRQSVSESLRAMTELRAFTFRGAYLPPLSAQKPTTPRLDAPISIVSRFTN